MLRRVIPPRYLGDFEVGAEIGRGAVGVVYRAQERISGRAVALKVVSRELAGSPGFYERFLREASVAARVLHPNVAALLAAGEQEGMLFLALELVTGGSLQDQLRARGRLPWEEATTLAAEIAHGLAAVHGAGLVHRDVTPANVLLDEQGRAKLADFGLVRRVGARSAAEIGRLTETGEVLGTLEYLSPEQANGTGEVGSSADLYGLGATLHALLAGAPPFQGDALGLVKQALLAPPPRLGSLVPGVPPALEALVLRLLEKDPGRRGQSALATAHELVAILGEEPAIESGRGKVLALAFALGMGAVGLGVGWLASRSTQHYPVALTPSSPVAVATPEPKRPPPADRAALESQLKDPELKELARRLSPSAPWKLEGIWGRPAWTGRSPIASGALLPSGQGFVTGGADWAVRRWDSEGHFVDSVPLGRGRIMALAVSPDGRWIAASSDRRASERGVSLYEVATRTDHELAHLPADALAFSRDSALLLSTHADGTLRVWDVANATERTCVAAHSPPLGPLPWPQRYLEGAFSPDGHRAITGCLDGTFKVWELSTRQATGYAAFPAPVTRVAWSPTEDRALVGLAGGRVAVVDLTTEGALEPVFVETVPMPQPVSGLAIAPDGLTALVTHQDGQARLLDLASSPVRVTRSLRVAPPGPIPFASFLDSRLFVTGGDMRALGLFDVAGVDRRASGAGHRGAVGGLDVSPDGRRALSAGTDGTLKVWDPATGRETPIVTTETGPPFVWAGILPDGRRALTSTSMGEARLWDLERGVSVGSGEQIVPPPPGFRGSLPLRVALFPDGERFLAAHPSGVVDVWDTETLTKRSTLHGADPWPVSAVTISGDGARALTASEAGELILWDLAHETSRVLQPPATPDEGEPVQNKLRLTAVAFVPGAATALVGALDATVQLWDLESGRLLRRFPTPTTNHAAIPAIVVAPSGRHFAAAFEDGAVRLFELASGSELERIDLVPSGDAPERLALMDGGHTLLVGTARGIVLRFALLWE